MIHDDLKYIFQKFFALSMHNGEISLAATEFIVTASKVTNSSKVLTHQLTYKFNILQLNLLEMP